MQWSSKHLLIYEPKFWYFLIALWTFNFMWNRRKLYLLSWQIPGPISVPFIGNLDIILRCGVANIVPQAKELIIEYSGVSQVTRMWFGQELFVLVGDASVASQVSSLTLTKADVYQHLSPPYFNKGLFIDTDIAHWKLSKKYVMQALQFKALKSFVPIFHEESLTLVHKLRKYTYSGQSFHPPKILALATYSTILRTMLGVNFNVQQNEHQPFIESVHKTFEHFQSKVFHPFLRSSVVYSLLGYRKDEKNCAKIMLELVQDMLDNQVKCSDRTTLSQALMQIPGITLDEVKAQIITVLGAGLDTSMVQNSLLFILLAIHPNIQDKVYEEMVQVLGEDSSVCPSNEDLKKLDYLDRVLKECLRMFPAAPIIARSTTEDITVTCSNGLQYTIPSGVTIGILIHYIQNSPNYYENPDCFDPDRWLPENSAGRDPLCFLPFSCGPRNCIGGKYALLQMKTFTVAILREFEILPSEKCNSLADVMVRMKLTLEVDNHCQIKLRKRERLRIATP